MSYKPPNSYLTYGLQYCAPNGFFVPTLLKTASTNTAFLSRFYAPEDISVTSLSVWCATSAASSSVRLGIYNTNGNLLGSNTAATTATGKITVTPASTISLKAGSNYYCALSSTSASTAFAAVPIPDFFTSSASYAVNQFYGTTVGKYLATKITVSGTAPALPSLITYSLSSMGNTIATSTTIFFILN